MPLDEKLRQAKSSHQPVPRVLVDAPKFLLRDLDSANPSVVCASNTALHPLLPHRKHGAHVPEAAGL